MHKHEICLLHGPTTIGLQPYFRGTYDARIMIEIMTTSEYVCQKQTRETANMFHKKYSAFFFEGKQILVEETAS